MTYLYLATYLHYGLQIDDFAKLNSLILRVLDLVMRGSHRYHRLVLQEQVQEDLAEMVAVVMDTILP